MNAIDYEARIVWESPDQKYYLFKERGFHYTLWENQSTHAIRRATIGFNEEKSIAKAKEIIERLDNKIQ